MSLGGGPVSAARETEVLAEMIRLDGNLEALDKEVDELGTRFESVLTQTSPSSTKDPEEPSRQTKLGATLQGKNRRLESVVEMLRDIRHRCEL